MMNALRLSSLYAEEKSCKTRCFPQMLLNVGETAYRPGSQFGTCPNFPLIAQCTPARTHSISGLKSQVLKLTFLA